MSGLSVNAHRWGGNRGGDLCITENNVLVYVCKRENKGLRNVA